jgi:hypothetical protein
MARSCALSPSAADGEPPNEKGVHSTRHDRFPKFESVSGVCFIVPPRERTEGLNGRSEGVCRRRFSLATVLRCFQ